MRASRALLTMEVGAYRYVLFLIAHLPSRLAYSIVRLAAELQYQVEAPKRRMTLRCIELALGGQLSPQGRVRVVHDHFRIWACRDLDRVRLTGNGRGLAKLVKVRGMEHLERALAQGKGAVIGSSHFGSWEAEAGLLGILGFPVTLVAYSWPQRGLSAWQRLARPNRLLRDLLWNATAHHLRPSIDFDEGMRRSVTFEAGRVLKRNQLVFVMLDVVGSPSRHPNAVPVPFLSGLAHVPSGAVRIAKSNGAPLLICLIHRSPDWRHQTMEISSPIPLEGDLGEVNLRCTRLIEDAIRREPAHWRSWHYKTMAKIGLLSEEEMKRLAKDGGPVLWS